MKFINSTLCEWVPFQPFYQQETDHLHNHQRSSECWYSCQDLCPVPGKRKFQRIFNLKGITWELCLEEENPKMEVALEYVESSESLFENLKNVSTLRFLLVSVDIAGFLLFWPLLVLLIRVCLLRLETHSFLNLESWKLWRFNIFLVWWITFSKYMKIFTEEFKIKRMWLKLIRKEIQWGNFVDFSFLLNSWKTFLILKAKISISNLECNNTIIDIDNILRDIA